MQRQKRERWETGFTLIEIMVSMVIASFVFAGIYGVYTIQQRSYTVQEQVSEMQQKGRAALDFMVRDIRMAGYNDPDGNCTSRNMNVWEATSEQFTFDKCEEGSTSPVVVNYFLDDAYESSGMNNGMEDDLYRSEDGGTGQLIVEGLDALQFSYVLESATSPGTFEAPVTAVTTANMARVRLVRISLLVRSTYPDQKYTETSEYVPGSGDAADWEIISERDGAGADPPLPLTWDKYHRRLLITTVKLRNMGL